MKHVKTDYLIIGSGIAGLSAAHALSNSGQTTIITKGQIKESSTSYAQGGIAAALGDIDTPKLHYEDTLQAGDGLCNPEAVKILVEEGPDRIRELVKMGANFDRTGTEFNLTQEAAHRQRRILHAGDATGREIEKTLGQHLLKQHNIRFVPHTAALQLTINKTNTTCTGCVVTDGKALTHYHAKAVLIATGGCGQLYARNTNPTVATGDGIILAYNAGCTLQDLAFMQFHPTTLVTGDKKPISLFLISEAVRGEGAVLRNIHGERFMPQYHPDAELAPRDIVARSIFSEMKHTKSDHVFLDLSDLNVRIPNRFPTIYKRCLEAGIDIEKDFIPVAPAAHYFMGGIQVGIWGETTINRLYAAGEVSSLGLHGANRLASNSLLDGLVFGHRAAQHILSSHPRHPTFQESIHIPSPSPIKMPKLLSAKQQIRRLMWNHVGIVRTKVGLTKALSEFEAMNWLQDINSISPEIHEIQNMHRLAQLITKSALTREESRGAHYREDFPKKNKKWETNHQELKITH